MKNNGKSSIIFLILIPLILIVTLIIIDTIISYGVNKKFKRDTETIIKNVLTNDELNYDEYYNEIKRLYEKKNYDTERLVVESDDYNFYLENEYNYFNLFSSLKNTKNKKEYVTILGFTFKAKRNSKAFIKVNADYDNMGKIIFTYTK